MRAQGMHVGLRAGGGGLVFGGGGGQAAADRAMNDQIGITAYGRSEMRVRRKGETEVPLVRGLVDGQRHAAQQHGFDQVAVVAARDQFHDAGVVAGLRVHAAAQLQAEFAEEQVQVAEFLLVRPLMVAEQRRDFGVEQKLRGGDIGREHQFFD